MNMNGKWEFPSNNHGEIQGINNAGIETFAAQKYESLVRESIQNSLDAKQSNYEGPVIVKIFQEHVLPENIPGQESLKMAFKKCLEVKSNDEKTKRFFSRAYSSLSREKNNIHILKVSDFNTTGLSGGKTGEREDLLGAGWLKSPVLTTNQEMLVAVLV